MKQTQMIFLIFSVALMLLPSWAGADALTLDDCIERALVENPELKAYKFAVKEADAGVGEAVGAFLPSLTLSYDFSKLYDSSGQGQDTDYIDQQTDRFAVRITQPLFAGLGNLAGLKKARENQRYREKELLFVTSRLVRDIRTGFYDVLLAEQIVVKRKDSVKRLEEQVLIAEAWVRQSLAPRVHLLETEVVLSNARQELIDAEATLAIAKARLEELLALEHEDQLEVVGSLQQDSLEACGDIDACLERAKARRAELELASLSIEMSRQDARMILARSLPRASLDGSWTDYQRDYDDNRRVDDNRDYYSVAVNLSFQPFDGGRTIYAYRRQLLAVERLEQAMIRQRNSIVAEVRTRFEQVVASHGRLQAANVTLTQAQEAYKLRKRSVELGVNSLRDLLDSSILLIRAEINMVETYHAMQLARTHLDFAVGG
jgi:outer membrane protein TolC